MEITIVSDHSIKLRGKNASVFVNPVDKAAQVNAAIILAPFEKKNMKLKDDVVVITGPGEYEAGGIKINGTKSAGKTVFSINIDGVDIALGDISALDALHQKMKEHHVLLALSDETHSASFTSTIATHVVGFFGAQAAAVVDTVAKEQKKIVSKYQISVDKLPTETETLLLSHS